MACLLSSNSSMCTLDVFSKLVKNYCFKSVKVIAGNFKRHTKINTQGGVKDLSVIWKELS